MARPVLLDYWASVEFLYENPDEPKIGGFVYLFLRAKDVRDAIMRFEPKYSELQLKIFNVEFVAPYLDIPGETEEEELKYAQMSIDAKKTSSVVFDVFYAYKDR